MSHSIIQAKKKQSLTKEKTTTFRCGVAVQSPSEELKLKLTLKDARATEIANKVYISWFVLFSGLGVKEAG